MEADDPKSLVSQAKDNIKKAKEYHELAAKAKEQQAHLQSFIAVWIEECKVRGYVLQMGADGDPGCTAPPETPKTSAAPAPQVNPAKK